MLEDEEGFLYPQINKSLCIDCGLCEKVCPILKRKKIERIKTYKKIYAVRLKDYETLMNSSSGGAFSALSDYVIKEKGSVVGVIYSKEMKVQHAFAKTKEECQAMQGSKYVQSDLGNTYRLCKDYLNHNKTPLLFTGTPCQVEGLKNFLGKPYDNLITIDIICHAVPSPKIFSNYVNLVNKKYQDKLINLFMRSKQKNGWGHNFSYLYEFKSGNHFFDPQGLKSWSTLFFSKMIDRPSCHDCQFCNLDRSGDITIADFWDDRNLRPDIFSKNGTSLFIINTNKGMNVFNKINISFHFWELSEEEALQPNLISPTKASLERKDFWKYYKRHGFQKTYKKYFTDEPSTIIKIKVIIWNLFHGKLKF